MTTKQDFSQLRALAAQLRTVRHAHQVSTEMMCEAADGLEALQAEVARLKAITFEPGHLAEHGLQIPTPREFGALLTKTLNEKWTTKVNALEAERDAALARLAALEKQSIYGFHWRKGWEWGFSLMGDFKASDKSNFTPLYAAAGASPVEPEDAYVEGITAGRRLERALVTQPATEDELREVFESMANDTHGFKRSRRGTYQNPSVARDWKWFCAGAALPSSSVEPAAYQGITPRPLEYPLAVYHTAPGSGPLHATWLDKPHRIVYDLVAALAYVAQPSQAREPDQSGEVVVTRNEFGSIVAVTRQDSDGRILKVIALLERPSQARELSDEEILMIAAAESVPTVVINEVIVKFTRAAIRAAINAKGATS